MSNTFKNRGSLNGATRIFFVYILLGVISPFALGSDKDVDGNASRLLEGNTNRLPLTLVWYDSYQLLPRALKTMSEEVNRIFDELGVSVHWKIGSTDDSHGEAAEDPLKLNVILHPNRATGWGLKEGVMAVATHREGMQGSVYVFFPEVVSAMGLDAHTDALDGPRATFVLVRALGRVVAHEVVHVLAPYHPHASERVMRSMMRRRFLLKRNVHMDPESAKVVREEIQARVVTRSGAPSPDRLGWLETPARSWRQPSRRRAAPKPRHR